jgi:hypothetical protein
MITELSEAQTATFPYYRKKWIDIGLCTEECDVEEAKKWIVEAYKVAKLDAPKFFIGPVNDPLEASKVVNILKEMLKAKTEFDNADHLNRLVLDRLYNSKDRSFEKDLEYNNQLAGNQEYWFSYADFFLNETEVTGLEDIKPLLELSKHIGWWIALEGVAILQHRPLSITFDDQERIHNTEGASIKFRGDSEVDVYAVHGIAVEKKIIDRDYTVDDIDAEMNTEIRRIMIDLYGDIRYIQDSGLEPVQTDEFGSLFVKKVPDDEDIVMVKVVNSTMEPDESFKDYWLRADPKAYNGQRTARAAVASTWRNKDGSYIFETPEDYDCEIET